MRAIFFILTIFSYIIIPVMVLTLSNFNIIINTIIIISSIILGILFAFITMMFTPYDKLK